MRLFDVRTMDNQETKNFNENLWIYLNNEYITSTSKDREKQRNIIDLPCTLNMRDIIRKLNSLIIYRDSRQDSITLVWGLAGMADLKVCSVSTSGCRLLSTSTWQEEIVTKNLSRLLKVRPVHHLWGWFQKIKKSRSCTEKRREGSSK